MRGKGSPRITSGCGPGVWHRVSLRTPMLARLWGGEGKDRADHPLGAPTPR